MIPNYSDWIQGVIDTGRAAEDDQVTPTLLVWMIDTGALDAAMPLAKLAIETQMASTDEYSRTMPESSSSKWPSKSAQAATSACPTCKP